MSPSAACYQVDNAPNLNDRLCPYDNPGVDLLLIESVRITCDVMFTIVRISANNWPSDVYKKAFPRIKDAWKVKALSNKGYHNEIVGEQTVYIKGWNINFETKSSLYMSAD